MGAASSHRSGVKHFKVDVRTLGMKETIESIARNYLGVETLETRHADSLDFHEVAVWQLERALTHAYCRGLEDQAEVLNYRSPVSIWGYAASSIVRTLHTEGFDLAECDAVLRSVGVELGPEELKFIYADDYVNAADLNRDQLEHLRERSRLWQVFRD